MLEKRKEYIGQLLSELKSLEERVLAVKNNDALPFSFFSELFDRTQRITRLLHELEFLQIDEMKGQMERLVLFLSESESRISKAKETKNGTDATTHEVGVREEEARKTAASETAPETIQSPEMARIPEPAQSPEPTQNPETNGSPETNERDAETHKTNPQVVPEVFPEQISAETAKKPISPEGNKYVQGIILPEYRNPRTSEDVPRLFDAKPSSRITTGEEKPVVSSLNDVIRTPWAVLDLKRSISLNDRFLFQRELFNNDRNEMNHVMTMLNAFGAYAEAENYLREHKSWNFENQIVKDFLLVIKKGFGE
jgi:hypothetical protein